MVKIVLFALLAVLGVKLADGCSCLYVHDQKAYCAGNYALEFRVTQTRILPWGPGGRRVYRYRVSNVKIYQKKNALKGVPRYIYSNVDGAACGRFLRLYKTYAVIGGYVENGRFWINSCNNIDNLSDKTLGQQNFARILLEWLYPASCNHCSICNTEYNSCHGNPTKYCDQSKLKPTSYGSLKTSCFPVFYRCLWYGEPGVV